MNTKQAFFIISAANGWLEPREIELRSETLISQIRARGYDAAPCKGRYDGVDEPGIVVVDSRPTSGHCLRVIAQLATVYQQHAFLAVDEKNNARLIFTDGTAPRDVGKFTAVTENIAKRGDAYTERLGWYYICVPATNS